MHRPDATRPHRRTLPALAAVALLAPGAARSQPPSAGARAALPAHLEAVVQLTAPRAGFVHMEIETSGDGLQTFSCITASASAGCRTRRRPQTLGAADRAELARMWAATTASAPCSIAYPSTAPTYRISWAGGLLTGEMLDRATHAQRGYDPCLVGGRIAWWVVAVHDRPNP
jgi:hypothetical protein